MTARRALIDRTLAAGLVIAAVAVSPFAIKLLSGRIDLPTRVASTSGLIAVFLLLLAFAAAAQGRTRHLLFHFIMWTAPIALIAMLELGAIRLRLADRILPLQDYSLLAGYDRWPAAHFMSEAQWLPNSNPKRYRAFHGNGVIINRFGLRTALPTSKVPDEWRVAITGGSTAWGYGVSDIGTIAAQLAGMLRRPPQQTKVYNFGIAAAQIGEELALLKEFRELYEIDQVVFYTGGNDVMFTYRAELQAELGGIEGTSTLASFELFRFFNRLSAKFFPPSSRLLERLDNRVLPRLNQINPLARGIVEADGYCRQVGLRCNFVLQPLLLSRDPAIGREQDLRASAGYVYPRLDLAVREMYDGAIAAGPQGRVHDFSSALNEEKEALFFDLIHLNEAGNRVVARRIASAVRMGP